MKLIMCSLITRAVLGFQALVEQAGTSTKQLSVQLGKLPARQALTIQCHSDDSTANASAPATCRLLIPFTPLNEMAALAWAPQPVMLHGSLNCTT